MVSVFLRALFLDAGVLPCSSQSFHCHFFPLTAVSPVQRGTLGGSGPAAPSFCIVAEQEVDPVLLIERFFCALSLFVRGLCGPQHSGFGFGVPQNPARWWHSSGTECCALTLALLGEECKQSSGAHSEIRKCTSAESWC